MFYEYEVVNTDSDEQVGIFSDLLSARRVARKLHRYEIWLNQKHNGNWEAVRRIEFCDPYDGDDDRIKQGLGEPNASER